MPNDLLIAILKISVSGSLIALLLFLAKPLVRNKFSKKWNYYIWLIVIARFVIPYGLPVNMIGDSINSILNFDSIIENASSDKTVMSIQNVAVNDLGSPTGVALEDELILPSNAAETESNKVLPQKDVNTIIISTPESSAIPTKITETLNIKALFPFIGYVWLSIALLLLAKKLINYYCFVQFIKKTSAPIDDDIILDASYNACMLIGIKNEIPVISNKTISSPMLVGLFKPIIVLPEIQIESISRLKYIFMHELTHFKRFDIYYKWLMQIALCIHWFNPIVYFVGKEVNKVCELSCDEVVIKKLIPKEQREYGDTLLRYFEMANGNNNPAVSLTLTENSKLMKERLGAILKYQKKSKSATVIATLLTIILCTGSMFVSVQGETVNKYAKAKTMNSENYLPDAEDVLQSIQPLILTTIGARAYTSKWASASGIEANTYKKQLDEKIKWTEALYNEKMERFMLYETISEKELTNTLGIKYMYEKSSVYRDMANTGETFTLLPYDSSFSRSGSKKYYERSVFYIDKPAVMTLNIFYELSEGTIALMLVSPEGETYYLSPKARSYDNNITMPLSIGLWSIITINESETGVIKGTQKIEGSFSNSKNSTISIDIKELKPDETKIYGPYYLNKKEAWSIDIKSFEGGEIFIADMKEGEAFQHSIILSKAPDGAAFLVDEARYYYIAIGNGGNTSVKNIKGDLTIKFSGTYQSPKVEDSINIVDSGNADEIKIDIPKIAPDGYVSYGPYALKKGDVVSADIKWSNDAGLYFSIGEEFLDYKGYYSTYNKYGEYLKKDLTVYKDGLYYIFIGNPSTREPEVKDVLGIVTIKRNTSNTTAVTKTISNNAISVDIPKISGKIYFENYGNIVLNEGDMVDANLDWKGEGHVMFLYTMEQLDMEDITQLVGKGVLPLGSVAKAFTNGYDNIPSLSTNFTYVHNNKEQKLNFTTTPNKPIKWSNNVPKTGSYYIYVIAEGDTGITDLKGDITFRKSITNASDGLSTLGFPSSITKDQLPSNLKSWIEECDKKRDIYLTSKNNRWYIYCNLVTGNYSTVIDNVTEPGSVKITISDSPGKGDGYALLSAPNYNNIQVFYKDKKAQFTDGNSKTVSTGNTTQSENGLDYFDKDSVVLEYYNKNSCTADNYWQNIDGYYADLKFMNYSGSKVIYEFDYQQETTVDFKITADVEGEYKIAFITESNKIITKASSYNNLSASKPIEFPKGKTKIVLIGEKATGNCTISFSE